MIIAISILIWLDYINASVVCAKTFANIPIRGVYSFDGWLRWIIDCVIIDTIIDLIFV